MSIRFVSGMTPTRRTHNVLSWVPRNPTDDNSPTCISTAGRPGIHPGDLQVAESPSTLFGRIA
jgi:hypothetical protein